jgi:4-hydroxythreonine-4-phosphate dehydrogenase
MALFFTCGDPLSINIEALLCVVIPKVSTHRPVIGIGSFWQLQQQAKALNLSLPEVRRLSQVSMPKDPGFYWFDPWPDQINKSALELSQIERGEIARRSLEAIPVHSDSDFAVLTAPVNKACMAKSGFKFPGQTEFFEDHWKQSAVMMLAGPKLKVALATNHLALSQVPSTITSELIYNKLAITSRNCQRLFGKAKPKIAVCALNPHASDQGMFGNEEQTTIIPAIKRASNAGFDVHGPFAADTIFHSAYQGKYDAVLAMYHDQGLVPIKTVHFDLAVNISMGLPFLRVSPDHGPASDLFLTGRASLSSFDAATEMCEKWLENGKKQI